ncbi:MAG: PAS domain S-box protein [Desulfitobacteriaceae bacterium]
MPSQQLFEAIINIDIFLDPQIYMEKMLKAICNILGFQCGTVIEVNQEGAWQLRATYMLPPEYGSLLMEKSTGVSGPLAEAVVNQRIVVVTDAWSEPRLSNWLEVLQEYNLRTIIWVPLISQEEYLGTYVIYGTKVRAVSTLELKTLEQIAYLVSTCITNNQYLVELNQKKLELEREIAQRKETEANLFKSEKRLRTILEAAPIGIVQVNLEWEIIESNPAFRQMVGYSEEELVGKKVDEIIKSLPEDLVLNKQLFNELINGQRDQFQLEKRYYNKEGKMFWGNLISSLARENENEFSFCITMIENITERKTIQEELLKFAKLESIGVLAGGIAHDFNNLLTVILGNISLIKMNLSNQDKNSNRLLEAEKASLQAKDLTQQLLTFAKGGKPLIKKVSIKELIKDSIQFVSRGSSVKFQITIANDLRMARIDEGQINQVLNNIFINALQSMPKGGSINLKAENIYLNKEMGIPLTSGNYIRISIQDQGCGILKADLPKVFDPYFTTKDKGSGLGLATSYSIIKNHKGHIKVKSEVGVGSIFEIYLPASSKDSAVVQQVSEVPTTVHARILFMDDEAAIREVVGNMLHEIGCEVEFAKDGEEAIQCYCETKKSGQTFDLVILDLTIPGGLGGKETLKQLLQNDPQVKAIISSGYSKDTVIANYKKYGFVGFITKPFKSTELSSIILKVLNKQNIGVSN